MGQELELFVWHRPEGGFGWQDGALLAPDMQTGISPIERAETRFLVAKPMEKPRHLRYNPILKYPALYREFASLEPTEEAYATFASEYGDLGVGVLIQARGLTEPCEPFRRWRSAHAKIRAVVDVLTAIQAGDARTLRQWFTIAKNGARYEREDAVTWHSIGWVTIAGELREFIWNWAMEAESDDDALLRIAQGWAQHEINEAIGGDRQVGTTSSARVVFDQDRKRMTLRVVPETLLGAMWFQCARVLTINPTFRTCKHCEKWFELSPDTRRKQAIYCSDRCKVAAYRARKGNSNMFAWMNIHYRRVRNRQDWDALSEPERIAALKGEINRKTNSGHEEQLSSMDRVGRWPRAMAELEESWLVGRPA